MSRGYFTESDIIDLLKELFKCMKVLFLSTNCRTQLWPNYKNIINTLRELKCKVNDDFVFTKNSTIERLPDKKIQQRAREISEELITCDALVYEGTISSTGGGYYLSIALREKIPTLFLAEERYTGLLLSEPNSFLQIKQYDPHDKKEIKEILSKFLLFAGKKRMSIRFNLMIDENINKFLEKNIKEKKTTKADYIRDLLYKEMLKISE